MELDLDVRGRRVLVIGGEAESRTEIARMRGAGAEVRRREYDGGIADGGTADRGTADSHAADGRVVDGDAVDQVAAGHGAADGGTLSAAVPLSIPTAPDWDAELTAVDLVVVVELPDAEEARLRTAAAARGAWVVRAEPAAIARVGHVTLIGGGPGDEGSLTIAGRDALRAADVIFLDRLAPLGAVDRWAPGAEIVDVGKTPGHHAVSQQEIERMLVVAALAGRTVVRLKGGDPYVFGRGGEEVAACRAAGVPVTVVSGVTSAIAVPAAAGVPVTHREVSRMFTVVSGHAPLDDDTVAHLAGLGGTLVVLMGVNTLPHLAAALLRHGTPATLPVAIVERGLTPRQRTTLTTLGSATRDAARAGVASPAVLVFGEVVRVAGPEPDASAALRDLVAAARR